MREATVKRLETIANERTGYITTEELLKSGITNRQIAVFVDKGMLEKISHGHYWLACAGCGKPAEYKAVESEPDHLCRQRMFLSGTDLRGTGAGVCSHQKK